MKNELSIASDWLISKDSILAILIPKIGPCTITKRGNYFQALVHSIIGQQISTKAAASIAGKFYDLLNNELSPENVRKFSTSELRAVGLSVQKATYILDLSEKFFKDRSIYDHLEKLEDEDALQKLKEVKGIGDWTAHMFLIFSLGRLNVLPVGDIGFQNAVMNNYGLRKKPTVKQLESLSKKWEPYRSVAVWYLWRSLEL